jgi:hypothetical protein
MPPGIPGNFGVPQTKGITEFARFRSTLPQSYNLPFVPTDWSQLRLAPYRRTEDLSENLLLTILSLNPTYLFRPPTVTNIRRIIPRRTYEVDQNLALTLLRTTLKPLTGNNLDWMRQQQVQVRAIEPEQNRIILPTTLAPLTKANLDWMRPQQVQVRPSEATRNTLILPTTLAPLTKANLDWMRPQQVQVRNIEPEQNRLILPTTLAPFIPQKASDDRSPFVPQRQYENTQNLSLTLLPTSVAPPVVSVKPKRHLPMMGVGR